MAELRAFPDRAAMARAAAADIAGALSLAAEAGAAPSLSICGGSSPEATYRALSETDAPWDRISVVLSDDRWIDPASEFSNEKLARDTLLQGKAGAAAFVGLKTGHDHPGEALGEIEAALAAVPRPVTLGVLGFGEDGHTASLFPGTLEGEAAMAPDAPGRVAAISRDGPGPVTEGVTMTLAELAAHRRLVFIAYGPAKRAIIDGVLAGAEDAKALPVARVAEAASGGVDFYWAP